MCFLKASNQKQTQNRPSAFKKIDSLSHQTNSQQIDQQINNFSQGVLPQKDLYQYTSSSSIQIDQSFYFQFSMLTDLMNYNNSLTLSLLEKNSLMESNICVLQKMVQELKESNKKQKYTQSINSIIMDDDCKGDQLIKNLFGEKQYKYELVVDTPFNMKLYKQRNFDLNLKLVDVQKNIILNSNPIPISFSIYTSDDEPQLIQTNKSGQPILKGNTQAQIYHGLSEFKKIHMREVTSYYAHGWVYFVIYAKAPSFSYNNRESNIEQVIDYSQIKPLVISDLVVRAKKK